MNQSGLAPPTSAANQKVCISSFFAEPTWKTLITIQGRLQGRSWHAQHLHDLRSLVPSEGLLLSCIKLMGRYEELHYMCTTSCYGSSMWFTSVGPMACDVPCV